MIPPLPSYDNTSIPDRRVLVDERAKVQGQDALLDSSNADSGNTPTWRFRKGNVIVLRTSTGRFVEANDSNGDANAAPSISSSSHTDGNGVITIVGNHGTISVTTTTGSGTEANNATDLNADAAFAAHYVASDSGGELVITARRTGATEWFYVATATMATAGFAEGVDNTVRGTTADYRVVAETVDLQDIDGTAVHAPAPTFAAGNFDRSNLINLTGEAEQVLRERGSLFDGA